MQKKAFFLCFLSIGFAMSNVTTAQNNLQSEFEQVFDKSCYLQTAKIDNVKSDTVYKLANTNADVILTQSGILLNYKSVKNNSRRLAYEIIKANSKSGTEGYLNDGDMQTVFEFDVYAKTTKQIILKLEKQVNTKDIIQNIAIKNNTNYEQYFSVDNQNWIKSNNSEDYDFVYTKIVFLDNEDGSVNNPNIAEIQFTQAKTDQATIVTKTQNQSDIIIWNNNKCSKLNNPQFETFEHKFYVANMQKDFGTDAETETLDPKWQNNPDFDDKLTNYVVQDTDNDGFADEVDNCPQTPNPYQKDKNTDGVGDLCADDDGDGWIGSKDNCVYIANPDQKDVNNNGIGDACEFDKDKDNVPDAVDNCITTANPDQKDADNDGIGDVCDNCDLRNSNQSDKDQNGIGDVCDANTKFEKENDKDADGKLDYQDNCKEIANPDQLDTDKDGVGDVCDNCPQIQNTDQKDQDKNNVGDFCEDVDKDSIIGYEDNCVYHSNLDQKDTDNDGVGDVCEDDDWDGVLASDDNCPNDYNSNQKDIDNDGIGDVCDKGDDRFIESNKTFFMLAGVLIVMIFGTGIWFMIDKLKKKE